MKKTIVGMLDVKMHSLRGGNLSEKTEQEKTDILGFMYYRSKLPFQVRQAYDRMQRGILDYKEKIDFSSAGCRDCEAVFNAVLLDTPLIFHVDSCKIIKKKDYVSVFPQYRLTEKDFLHSRKSCFNALLELKNFIRRQNEMETVASLHSFMAETVRYKDSGIEAHHITGPLLNHRGVCDGIAKMAKAVCDSLGIACVVINGEAMQGSGDIGKHAWNAICFNSKWSYFDFTFDITLNQNNPCSAIQCMDYFSLDYSSMAKDHFKWSADMPSAGNNEDYFTAKRLVIRKQNDMDALLGKKWNGNVAEAAFKVSIDWKNFNIEQALGKTVEKIVKRGNKGCRYTYTFNDRQRTGYVRIE